jgi:hypothetical protein
MKKMMMLLPLFGLAACSMPQPTQYQYSQYQCGEEITGNTIKGLDFDKGKEIANDIAAGLENDVKGDWEYTQSAVLLSSNFMDWLAGLEDNNNSMETEDIKEDSGLLSDGCIPKEKSHINW